MMLTARKESNQNFSMGGFDDTGISNVFNLISSMLPELTKLERKVAEFVLSERS